MWAATAHVRRNALVFRLVLVCISVAAIGACCLAVSRGNVIIGWLLFGVSLFAAATFVVVQVALLEAKRRRVDCEPIQSQTTFRDDGFAYHNTVHEFFVSWSDVRYVRKTPVYWALHYMCDGKEASIVIPSDAIDGELGSLIDDQIPMAQNS